MFTSEIPYMEYLHVNFDENPFRGFFLTESEEGFGSDLIFTLNRDRFFVFHYLFCIST